MKAAGFRLQWPSIFGEKREWEKEAGMEGRIKTNGSNPLKLMTVCLSEWIYLSQMPEKLALKWFWWQTQPGYLQWQTPKNVYVYRSWGRGAEKGCWCEKEKKTERATQYGEIIREVRLGKEKKTGQEKLEKKCWKEIKYVRRQRKGARLKRTSSTVEVVELWVTLDKDFSRKKKGVCSSYTEGVRTEEHTEKSNRGRYSYVGEQRTDAAHKRRMLAKQKKIKNK